LRALGEYLNIPLPYNRLKEVRRNLTLTSPHYGQSKYTKTFLLPETFKVLTKGIIKNVPLDSSVTNFYMTDAISKSSYTMALCTNRFLTKTTNFVKE
jgi:hypothetical protein